MPNDRIRYRKLRRYKYQLRAPYEYKTEIAKGPATVDKGWVVLEADGLLKMKDRYAWDGPSGPTIDTKNFMRGSLVHDALYQLMREGPLGEDQRKSADQLLRKICREDGMSWLRAAWVYAAVRAFGGRTVRPRPGPPDQYAP